MDVSRAQAELRNAPDWATAPVTTALVTARVAPVMSATWPELRPISSSYVKNPLIVREMFLPLTTPTGLLMHPEHAHAIHTTPHAAQAAGRHLHGHAPVMLTHLPGQPPAGLIFFTAPDQPWTAARLVTTCLAPTIPSHYIGHDNDDIPGPPTPGCHWATEPHPHTPYPPMLAIWRALIAATR